MNADSGRSVLYDEDEELYFGLLFFEAAISVEKII
jgi:hypothetical protein